MKNCNLLSFVVIVSLICCVGFTGCSGSLDQEKGASSGGLSLKLGWPEGYRYDRATSRLHTPDGETQKEAPPYITKITLTIFGQAQGPIVIDIPKDTLQASVKLSAGERKMYLRVDTDIIGDEGSKVVFTATVITTIVPGVTREIVFEMEVNEPPVIKVVNVSNLNPAKREIVTATAVATDRDPDDVLTYSWRGVNEIGETDTYSGPSISGAPDHGGVYFLTLTVDDGHGGVARRTVEILVINHPPVIVNFTAIVDSATGEVNLVCRATDIDNDPIEYILIGPNGERVMGQTATFTGTCGDYKCVVHDFDNGEARAVRTLQNNLPIVTGVFSSSQFAKPGDNLTLSCLATDPDNDPIEYFWNVGNNLMGSNVLYAFQGHGDSNIECIVEDVCHGQNRRSVQINNGQEPANGGVCSTNFNNGVVRASINWSTAADLDLEISDSSGTRVWYGHLRPGNNTELCIDVACNTGGGGAELIYWAAGSTPATAQTFSAKVTYSNDCGAGTSASYSISFNTNGNCVSTGYCFTTVTGGSLPACGAVNNCATTEVISLGSSITYTFTLQNP